MEIRKKNEDVVRFQEWFMIDETVVNPGVRRDDVLDISKRNKVEVQVGSKVKKWLASKDAIKIDVEITNDYSRENER